MIKPGELQCDDWIFIKEPGCFARVVKVSKDTVCVEDFGELSYDECDGVHLQSKHLVNIGFLYLSTFNSYCLFDKCGDELRVLIRLIDKGSEIVLSGTVLRLKYIHQLQHLLRSVGMDIESQILKC